MHKLHEYSKIVTQLETSIIEDIGFYKDELDPKILVELFNRNRQTIENNIAEESISDFYAHLDKYDKVLHTLKYWSN